MIYGIPLILGFFNSRNTQHALLADVNVKISLELADEADKIVEENFLDIYSLLFLQFANQQNEKMRYVFLEHFLISQLIPRQSLD